MRWRQKRQIVMGTFSQPYLTHHVHFVRKFDISSTHVDDIDTSIACVEKAQDFRHNRTRTESFASGARLASAAGVGPIRTLGMAAFVHKETFGFCLDWTPYWVSPIVSAETHPRTPFSEIHEAYDSFPGLPSGMPPGVCASKYNRPLVPPIP